MRGLALSALLFAACSGGPPAATASVAPTASATAATSPVPPTASPSAAPTFAADATPRSFTRVALDAGGSDGVVTKDLRLELGPSPSKGTYADPYGGTVSDERGTWVSAPVPTPLPFDGRIPPRKAPAAACTLNGLPTAAS